MERKLQCRKLDMSCYPRKAHFQYFCSMAYPYAGMTVNVDVTKLAERAKAAKESFFLHMLYAAGNAANQVQSFRQRIVENEIWEYDACKTSHTVLKPDDTYAYCQADPVLPFPQFLRETATRQPAVRENGGLDEAEDPLAYYFISCVPWISYTDVTQPVPNPPDSNPRIVWGKYFQQADRLLMPVTVLVNHALVDGRQIADFYQALDVQIQK